MPIKRQRIVGLAKKTKTTGWEWGRRDRRWGVKLICIYHFCVTLTFETMLMFLIHPL